MHLNNREVGYARVYDATVKAAFPRTQSRPLFPVLGFGFSYKPPYNQKGFRV